MFSKACEYAIRAVIFIHGQSAMGSRVSVQCISEETGVPGHFMAKVLQTLRSAGVVSSAKGPSGGFYLNDEQQRQALINVVRAIDGDKIFSGCGLGLPYCSEQNPCAIHHEFAAVRDSLHHMLHTSKISDLSAQVLDGGVLLKRS